MHSTHSNFSRNSRLQVATLPRVCFLLHLLQSFCHLLKILSKSLYCVAMKQQIRGEKSKPQKGKPIILVCGFETCLHVLIFIVNGHFTIWQHSWNFSGDHGFLHLTVKGIASETEKKKALILLRKGELFSGQKLHVSLGMIIDIKNYTDFSGSYLHNFSYHIWLIQQWQLHCLIVQFESVTASE